MSSCQRSRGIKAKEDCPPKHLALLPPCCVRGRRLSGCGLEALGGFASANLDRLLNHLVIDDSSTGRDIPSQD